MMSLVVMQLPVACRLDAVNIGWTNMTRGAVLYLVICLPNDLTKLNLSGCRTSLLDEGSRHFVCPHFTNILATSNTVIRTLTLNQGVRQINHCSYTKVDIQSMLSSTSICITGILQFDCYIFILNR